MKSIIATVLFPAWLLGQDPTLQIVCASYSQELGSKLARDCRTVMRDEYYQRLFPNTRLDPERAAVHDFTTTVGGGRRTVSVGGTFTGLGADTIICDDLMSAVDASSKTVRDSTGEWIDFVMRSRLNNPTTGTISIIAQRLHEDDPIGRMIAREPDVWKLIELPAIAETRQTFDLGRGRTYTREADEVLEPRRMPLSYLEEQKRSIGTAAFNAQYQQRPVPARGNMVLRDWFQDFRIDELDGRSIEIHQSWDLAMKTGEQHDYSVCITFGVENRDYRRGNIYILDIFRHKLIYPDLRKAIITNSLHWQAKSVLIEDKVVGTGMIQDLRQEGVVRPIAYPTEGDKTTRLSLQSAKIEQGRVFLDSSLPESQDFLAEILSFPNGKHDDQVDALTQFLHHLDDKAKRVFSRGNY